jgi:amino acid adenylation domain-containing protein/FkbH-like protein
MPLTSTVESALTGGLSTSLAKVPGKSPTPSSQHQFTESSGDFSRLRIAIAANFTAEPLEDSLQFWVDFLDWPYQIAFGPFDQVFQQLLSPDSVFAKNQGVNIVLLRLDSWLQDGHDARRADENVHLFLTAIKQAAARAPVPYLVCLCPSSPRLTAVAETQAFLTAAQQKLRDGMAGIPGVALITDQDVLNAYPVDKVHDLQAEAIGAIPYSTEFFAALGTYLARRIYSLKRSPYKVIALDCDNTLWKGVVGEDGPAGISLTDRCRKLQEFVVRQSELGMLVCLCSKNNEADVWEAFAAHPEMPLQREHIVAQRINWEAKSGNLRSLADQLGLGVDSFCFIDDSPMECAEVRQACPEVLTLPFPENEEAEFLRGVWAFDRAAVTLEDRQRTEQYRQNAAREAERAQSANLSDFLAALELRVDFNALTPERVARVADLTQRTNQFNATTIRRHEAEIAAMLAGVDLHCFTVDVSDRFGDYGLVGVVIYRLTGVAVAVDSLLLSCRALGRGVEYRMLAELGRIARDNNLAQVDVPFLPTRKNQPIRDFLEAVGSEFRQTDARGDYYGLPTKFACMALQRMPQKQTAAAPVEKLAVPAAGDVMQQSAKLSRIAAELRGTSDVLRAIAQRRGRLRGGGEFVAPRNETERALAKIWQEVLYVDRVGAEDGFFELGGNSLRAAVMLARVQEQFQVALGLAVLIERPALGGLAQAIETASADPASILDAPTRRPDIADRAALSLIQQRFWIIDRAVGNRAIYNVCPRMRLRGRLDVGALQAAWAAVVERQESLRTQFIDEGGPVVQVVLPSVPCAIELVDLRSRPAELEVCIAQESQKPFDLATAPLWRVVLYRVGDDEHVLFWNIHVILMDESSRAAILRDLWTSYERSLGGKGAKLDPLKVRYTDFSAWQREQLDEARLAPALAHWKKCLTGASPPALPPYFKSRPKQRSWAGGLHRFDVPARTSEAVARRAREAGVTPFVLYLAALQALLSRYSNQADICVGTAATNRPTGAIDDVVGCFVNVVAIRADLGGEPAFREVVGRVREAVAVAMKHADVPLERIVDEIRSQRTGGAPLFQVAMFYHSDNVHGRTADGLMWEVEPTDPVGAKFDLSLHVAEAVGGMLAAIEYNSDLYDEADAQHFAGHYLTLLDEACRSPETSVSRLPLLTRDEYRQIVLDWNRTAASYPAEAVIQQAFEERVREAPKRIAVVAGGREFTYAEIDESANRLAHFLIAQGLTSGSFAGICLKRSEQMIVAALAVLKAGGAYVPLDPAYPKDRLAFMLRDTGAALVITQSVLLERLPDAATGGDTPSARVLCVDQLGDELAKQSAEAPQRRTSPDDRAYVIFTSGSTGRPKGVLLRHRPVVNVLDWVNRSFVVTPSDRVLFVTSLSFDLSVYDIFGVLGAGASIRIASEEEMRDPTVLLRILKTEPITIWDSAPAALSQLAPFFAARDAASDVSQKRPTAPLRLVMLSGDWIPVPLPDQVRAEFSNARIISLGGATEAAIWSNWYPIERVDPAWPSIPYGKPIRNARYHILDANLQPVPAGVPGELHIGGEVLADGYLHREELTRERFIDDPLLSAVKKSAADELATNGNGHTLTGAWPVGGKLYKTGDLARYFPDGNIEFLGRMDTQVKVRGFRVEAGEIEAVIAQQDGVQDAVVKPHKDSSNQNYLVAYVVAKPGRSLVAAEISKRLQKQLPEYMVPAQVVFLDALPLTPNGKVDRGALAAPAVETGHGAAREGVKPANDAERALVAIWEEVLGVRPIGVTDDFHELGGHSLRAAMVMALVESRLGHRVPIEALLSKPTIRELAEIITSKLELSGGVVAPLQTGGAYPPLFMVAGVGGHVFAFHSFARRLGSRFNVYGMRAVGIDGTEAPLESIDAIAARYLKEIKAECPEGPYVLSGYSVGGMIAFELAQQMQAAGMKVSRVVIFDLWAPGSPKQLPVWQRLVLHARTFFGLNWRGKWKYLRKRYENLRLRILATFGRYEISPEEVPGIDQVPQERIHAVLSMLLKAACNYWPPRPLDAQLVVVSSSIPSQCIGYNIDDLCMGWARWTTKPVKTYQLNAPHTEFFRDEYVDQVVHHIREIMDAAKAERDAPVPAR